MAFILSVTRTEQDVIAGQGEKILMVAIGSANSGEALMKVATFQVFTDNRGNSPGGRNHRHEKLDRSSDSRSHQSDFRKLP
jgi:hypothetical protein